jgi:hypothetical protein
MAYRLRLKTLALRRQATQQVDRFLEERLSDWSEAD